MEHFMDYLEFQRFVYKLTAFNRMKGSSRTAVNVRVHYPGGVKGTYSIQSTEEFVEIFDIMWDSPGLLYVEVFTTRKNIIWYNLNYN